MKKRYLVLSNGEVFEGTAFGADCGAIGELVFTTNVCGYEDTLTDPSYYGQIVLHTFPMIGNYGMIPEDFEGECRVSGYVVREWCESPSNFRCQMTVDEFLKKKGIPGISGVDTRQLTRIIRDSGVMNASITDTLPVDWDALRSFAITNAVAAVSGNKSAVFEADAPKYRVALLDYGAKKNIVRELNKRGCSVTVLPHDTTAEEILSGGYDGVMLSNGPGDPSENTFEIEQIAKLFGRLPLFGICLGHQLMALSQGGKTVKLKYGHRGGNQPVKDCAGTRTYISSQNHGYAVVADSVKNGKEIFRNANDNTCEGMVYDKALSVQFHPEACAGPHDTSFLFDDFVTLMEETHHAS